MTGRMCRPEQPSFANGAERQVWTALRDPLADDASLLCGLRVSNRAKDHEADVVIGVPGAGMVVVEVKGGSVWHTGEKWQQRRGRTDVIIDPGAQARGTRYALRDYVEHDPRWGSRRPVRWAHAVVLPHTELPADFALPDCPRWMVADRGQLGELAKVLTAVPEQQVTGNRGPTAEDLAVIADILRGRGLPQRDVVAEAAARDADAMTRLTQEQAVIIGAIQLLPRVEVRGGAGSGKTWLALEQARRLGRQGQRVALLCYSRGLASFLRRTVSGWPRREQPAYVGEFHGLGTQWGAQTGSDDDSDHWENRLPAQMIELAAALPPGQRFDAVVIDEAQDFAESWWPAVLASLKDEDTGGIYAFSDEGQRVFARYGRPPVPLVPLVLDHNLRNTRQIAESFNSLSTMRMKLFGGDGPEVTFAPCAAGDAVECADDAVDQLIDEGWRPEHIALLTTGSRHPEQAGRQAVSQADYWESFWDKDSVFYGHVLGFKGLERRAVVLALNERTAGERSRERLYVGLSRARDRLIVCGDPAFVLQVGGPDVLRRIETVGPV